MGGRRILARVYQERRHPSSEKPIVTKQNLMSQMLARFWLNHLRYDPLGTATPCGLPEGQLRSELNDTLECGRFTAIRNETELRGACFTAYRSQTCSQITSGAALPASCSMQFSRVASSSGALVDADAGQSLSSDAELLPAAEAASQSLER